MFHIVQRPDGFYIVDQGGKVVDGPFETRFLASQAMNRMENPEVEEEPEGPPMGVPPMGPGGPMAGGPPMGPPGVPPMGPGGPGGAPPMDPQMLMALLAKMKGGG